MNYDYDHVISLLCLKVMKYKQNARKRHNSFTEWAFTARLHLVRLSSLKAKIANMTSLYVQYAIIPKVTGKQKALESMSTDNISFSLRSKVGT